MTRAAWGGSPGNPIVFDTAHLLSAAALADGDAGARAWIRAHPKLVDAVECGHLGRGDDIDTPADLRSWHRDPGDPGELHQGLPSRPALDRTWASDIRFPCSRTTIPTIGNFRGNEGEERR